MGGDPRGFDEHEIPGSNTPTDENLSASFLPYDDSRLWLQMPEAEGKKSGRRKRERAQKAPKAPKAAKQAKPATPAATGEGRLAGSVLSAQTWRQAYQAVTRRAS